MKMEIKKLTIVDVQPCPYCGIDRLEMVRGKEKIDKGYFEPTASIKCLSCEMTGPVLVDFHREAEELAVEYWNTISISRRHTISRTQSDETASENSGV